jgi:ABC-type multidrug transport system ATPase subunit
MDVEMQIGNTAKIEAVPIKHIDAQDDDDIKSMHVEEKEINNQQNNIQIEINNKDKILKVEERESHRPINSEAAPFGKSERTRMSEPGDLELVWSDLTITASISEGKCCSKIITQKKILDKVSGRVKSGECLAILGSSGAGKTTLLNYLSRKIESSSLKVEGNVSLNSENISSKEFDSIASYVMQDDILEATMTPTEILMFTAKMKFKLPLEKIEQKVFDMIQDLNLKKCQNTRIGDKITRGVSGGERKRTSIGVELISDPKIIFLDEPTTGLDSYNAYELIQLLKNLSQKNRMIIFTIHQPSSEIYGLLDKINILALGKTIYFGPQKKCFECFDNLKIPVPLKYNPFEHFMEVTNVATIEDPKILSNFPELNSIENKLDKYSSYISNLNGSFERIKNEFFDFTPTVRGFTEETKQNIIDKGIRQNFFYEFGLIFGRNMVISRRNPKVLYMKIAQAIVTALLVSLLFVRVK